MGENACVADRLLGGHVQIVLDLLDRLQAFQTGDTKSARVVVLRGPSGSGKSRIVRELYERLRACGGEPSYWPELAGAGRVAAVGADPMAARKEIAPSLSGGFIWSAGTLPTFGWWGFNCERLNANVGQDVVSAARPQLDAHLLPLTLAWRDHSGLLDKAKANRERIVSEVRDAALDEGGDALFDYLESLNIVIPYVGTLLNWGWKGGKALRQRAQDLKALRTEVDLGEEHEVARRSAGVDLAKVIRSVAHHQLPGVVAIEDMHLMGAELGALVDHVSSASAASPLMVVGTAWPEGFDNPEYAKWLSQARRRGAVEVIDVPSLDDRDLVEMLRWYAPSTSDDTAERVVRQLNNPQFLKLWLTLNKTQRHIKRNSGGILPDAAGNLELPDDVRQVLAERWVELPQETRTSLMCAVAANPIDDALSQFVPEVIAEVAHLYGEIDHASALRGLGAAVDPAGWCRFGDAVEFFVEGLLAATARRHLRIEYEDADLDAIRTLTNQYLVQWIDSQRDGIRLPVDPRTLTASRWHLAYTDADEIPPRLTPVQPAAQWVLAQGEALSYEYGSAVDLSRSAAQGCSSLFGPTHPDTLAVRSNLAIWLGELGQLDAAIGELESLLADRLRVLGPDHPDTLTTRHNLARWRGESGQVDAAILELGSLLVSSLRVLGSDHPDTLTTRHYLARWLGESGQVKTAIVEFERLLADRLRVLGPDHPDTLNTRSNLASRRGESGRVDTAIVEFERLLADRLRVLGPDHPDTLNTRNNLARWLGRAGRVNPAIAAFERLLADRERVLGPDHPDCLTTRNNLAFWLAKSGQVEPAIAAFERLLADRQRVLGPDHPRSLTTRSNLASWLGEFGQVDAAIAAFGSLLVDRRRVLGPDHPDTLSTRSNLAFWRGESGQVDAAIAAFESLLVDRQRVLGPDHPDTLTTRHHLARWRGESGQVNAAIVEFESVLADRRRVLGPDHPATLNTRSNLARWRRELGQVDAAIVEIHSLLTDRLQVLGPDHPDTLATRHDLADWLGDSGKVCTAISQFQSLLADRQRVLGPDHPDTLATRDHLANWRSVASMAQCADAGDDVGRRT